MAFFTQMLGRAAESGALPPVARRALFRRLGGAGLALAGVNLALADRSWAAVEKRAEFFGIEPGTFVDAKGRPADPSAYPANPLLGSLQIYPYNFAPRDWAFCQGQLLPISQNEALFSLLGTTFGGNGIQTFGLPDFRGRGGLSSGTGPGLTPRPLGQMAGSETVTLNLSQLPSHNHTLEVSTTQTPTAPNNEIVVRNFNNAPDMVAPNAISLTGGNQPHENMAPYLTLNVCIALYGVYPTRS